MDGEQAGDHMNEQVLYESDDQFYPAYHLKVIRKNNDVGHLILTFNGNVIHCEDVPLAYGAQFGADRFDIENWGIIACQKTDEHRADNA